MNATQVFAYCVGYKFPLKPQMCLYKDSFRCMQIMTLKIKINSNLKNSHNFYGFAFGIWLMRTTSRQFVQFYSPCSYMDRPGHPVLIFVSFLILTSTPTDG